MSYIAFNALSTVLGGSFTARLFLPGLDKLALDDRAHQKRYPVIWLLHTDGETSLEFLKTPIESLAVKYGFIAIAPDMHHAMGTDMKWGPNYEKFLVKEIRGIFRNNLPISTDPRENFIGGVGTGGYAALKIAARHPDLYAKAFALNGVLDMEELFRRTLDGERTGIPQTAAALEAVFGSFDSFRGSENDLFHVAKNASDGSLYISAERDFPYYRDSEKLCRTVPDKVCFAPLEEGADFESYQRSLRDAAAWLFA